MIEAHFLKVLKLHILWEFRKSSNKCTKCNYVFYLFLKITLKNTFQNFTTNKISQGIILLKQNHCKGCPICIIKIENLPAI